MNLGWDQVLSRQSFYFQAKHRCLKLLWWRQLASLTRGWTRILCRVQGTRGYDLCATRTSFLGSQRGSQIGIQVTGLLLPLILWKIHGLLSHKCRAFQQRVMLILEMIGTIVSGGWKFVASRIWTRELCMFSSLVSLPPPWIHWKGTELGVLLRDTCEVFPWLLLCPTLKCWVRLWNLVVEVAHFIRADSYVGAFF